MLVVMLSVGGVFTSSQQVVAALGTASSLGLVGSGSALSVAGMQWGAGPEPLCLAPLWGCLLVLKSHKLVWRTKLSFHLPGERAEKLGICMSTTRLGLKSTWE